MDMPLHSRQDRQHATADSRLTWMLDNSNLLVTAQYELPWKSDLAHQFGGRRVEREREREREREGERDREGWR